MFDILLQTPDFVVINKPAGLSVHRDQNDSGLTEMLAQQLGVPQLWLVHRLDKPTSGALLLALNADAASELAQAFANREVKKTYLALGDRKPSKKQGWIKGDMVRSRQGAWKLTRSMENPAQTRFSSHSSEPGRRLFVLQPLTGKTHQLRVAMKSLGSPILGDTLYGGTPADRLYLHAWRLSFSFRGDWFTVEAPLGEGWPRLPEEVRQEEI